MCEIKNSPTKTKLYNTCLKCPKCNTYLVKMYYSYEIISEDEEGQTTLQLKNYVCENNNCGAKWTKK